MKSIVRKVIVLGAICVLLGCLASPAMALIPFNPPPSYRPPVSPPSSGSVYAPSALSISPSSSYRTVTSPSTSPASSLSGSPGLFTGTTAGGSTLPLATLSTDSYLDGPSLLGQSPSSLSGRDLVGGDLVLETLPFNTLPVNGEVPALGKVFGPLTNAPDVNPSLLGSHSIAGIESGLDKFVDQYVNNDPINKYGTSSGTPGWGDQVASEWGRFGMPGGNSWYLEKNPFGGGNSMAEGITQSPEMPQSWNQAQDAPRKLSDAEVQQQKDQQQAKEDNKYSNDLINMAQDMITAPVQGADMAIAAGFGILKWANNKWFNPPPKSGTQDPGEEGETGGVRILPYISSPIPENEISYANWLASQSGPLVGNGQGYTGELGWDTGPGLYNQAVANEILLKSNGRIAGGGGYDPTGPGLGEDTGLLNFNPGSAGFGTLGDTWEKLPIFMKEVSKPIA